LACLALTTALAAPTGGDDWRPGTFMKQATDAVIGRATAEISQHDNFGYDHGISVLGGCMEPKGDLAMSRFMDKGTKYTIVVAGDEDVKGVDLFLTDSRGQCMASTTGDANRLSFTPSDSGQYTLRVNLAKAPKPSFVAVAILSNNGWKIPSGNLELGLGRVLGSCTDVSSKAPAKFHDRDNQWSLYGAVLKPGEAQTINNISFGKMAYAMLAACDDESDLAWLNSSGKVMKEDTEQDAKPGVIQSVEAGLYGVRVSNSKSAKPTMAVWVVLEVDLDKS
jgi:hypothetical protein